MNRAQRRESARAMRRKPSPRRRERADLLARYIAAFR